MMCDTPLWLKCLHERVMSSTWSSMSWLLNLFLSVPRLVPFCVSLLSLALLFTSTWTLAWSSSSMWSTSGQLTTGTLATEESGPLAEFTPLTDLVKTMQPVSWKLFVHTMVKSATFVTVHLGDRSPPQCFPQTRRSASGTGGRTSSQQVRSLPSRDRASFVSQFAPNSTIGACWSCFPDNFVMNIFGRRLLFEGFCHYNGGSCCGRDWLLRRWRRWPGGMQLVNDCENTIFNGKTPNCASDNPVGKRIWDSWHGASRESSGRTT